MLNAYIYILLTLNALLLCLFLQKPGWDPHQHPPGMELGCWGELGHLGWPGLAPLRSQSGWWQA